MRKVELSLKENQKWQKWSTFSNIKISYLFSFQDKVSSYLWLISLDISNICALYANLSTIAPVSIASLNISSHLSKVKFVVIIIDPLSFLFDSKLNNISYLSYCIFFYFKFFSYLFVYFTFVIIRPLYARL